MNIGILPFISFKNKIIDLRDFAIFTDSNISEVAQVSKELKSVLIEFSNHQKQFFCETYNNSQVNITFVLPTSSDINKEKLEQFFEILFFFLHKGNKFTYFFSTPNIFCQEDFKNIIFEIVDDENIGDLIIKKKWKFQFIKSLNKFIIPPVGCENIVTQYEDYNYRFRNIDFDSNNNIFKYLYECLGKDEKSHILRAIVFYNRAMGCELKDEERFVWLSSSLESFLKINKGNDKKKKIAEEIRKIICTKNFELLDKEETSNTVAELITVVYDYRSSYVHGSDKTTESKEIEKKLKQKFGTLDFVSALMNLTSYLLVHNVVPDNKFEGILNVTFNNQDIFKKVLKIYSHSADKALKELKIFESTFTIHAFLYTDLQILSLDRVKVRKCMDNILYIFAKFAKENQNLHLGTQIQQKINIINCKDKDKFKKWNLYFNQTKLITPNLEILYLSKLVFQKLFHLLEFETVIY